MSLTEKQLIALEEAVDRLKSGLGDQLESIVLYGSATRPDGEREPSSVNLLIMVKESLPREHAAIARALSGSPLRIEPFVVGRRGFERSRIAFAVKFLSIGRNYRLLYGPDPLKDFSVDPTLRRFLAEQALRNLRLRLAHAFIVSSGDSQAYLRWVMRNTAALFTDLCEPMRIEGMSIAAAYVGRVESIQGFYEIEAGVLTDLLKLKEQPRRLNSDEAFEIHARLFALLDRAVFWVEERWPLPQVQ